MASSRARLASVWDASGDTSNLLLRALATKSGCTWATLARLGDVSCSVHSIMGYAIGKDHYFTPYGGLMDFHDPYMQWYRRITQHFMTPQLHRDDMRFHTTVGSTNVLVS